MFYIVAGAFFPLLFLLVVPIGLAVIEMTGRREGPRDGIDVALAPLVGVAFVITVVSLLLHFKAPAGALLPAVALIDVLALWGLRGAAFWSDARRSALWLLICSVVFLILIAPLLLEGRFGVLGYTVNNDPVFHNIMAEYLDVNGYDFPSDATDGFTDAAVDKFIRQGYPDGWHQILLLAMRLFGQRAFALFNFTEAFFMALMAPVAYAWLRVMRLPGRWAVFGGVAAALGYIQLTYLFQGFAPQVAVTPFIYATLLLFYLILIRKRSDYLIPAALLLQASVAVYSFTILLWLAVFVGLLLLYRAISMEGWRGFVAGVSMTGKVAALAAVINPFTLIGMVAAFRMVTGWSAVDTMGNLVTRQVPLLPILGTWLAPDHRSPPAFWFHLGSYAAAALVLLAAGAARRRNDERLLMVIGSLAMLLPMVLVKAFASSYYFAKTIQLAAPMAAMVVVAGVYSVSQRPQGRSRAVLLLVVYLAVLGVSDLIAVKATQMTPDKPFAELVAINKRFAGSEKSTLYVETGEDWGKYFLSNFKTASPFAVSYIGRAPSPRRVLVGSGINDLDSLSGIFGRRFNWIVITKRQDVSLPPPPFEIVFSGKFYNVYKKAPSSLAPVAHRPFEILPGAAKTPYFELKPGEELTAAVHRKFHTMLVAAYTFPAQTVAGQTGLVQKRYGANGGSAVFSLGARSAAVPVTERPHVYGLPLKGDSGDVLRVKNSTHRLLRLDWIEPLRRPYDRAALFRYNYKNRYAWQAAERSVKVTD